VVKRFHVGDTPMDIQAALAGGAMPIGVSTGIFSSDELKWSAEGKPMILLSDMADTDAVLKAMGL
jgi:phosphoglycolate phosphatase